MVIVVYKRKLVVDIMGRAEIYMFKETIDIEYLEGLIEKNKKAIEYITKLQRIIEKLETLGIESKVEVELSDWRENYLDIDTRESDGVIKVYITIPAKKKDLEIFKFIREKQGKQFDVEVYKELIKLASIEREKAIKFLEQLERNGLIVYVKERDTDC